MKKAPSLRAQVFLAFIIFLAITLLLLWLTEGVFLKDIYKAIKSSQMNEAAEKLTVIYSGENPSYDEVDEVARKYNTCVLVLKMDGALPVEVAASRHVEAMCDIHGQDGQPDSFFFGYYATLYEKALSSGGEVKETFNNIEYDPTTRSFVTEKGGEGDSEEDMLCLRIVGESSGVHYAVLLNSVISPLGSTVRVLSAILIVVSVFLLFIAFLFALFLSKQIARPIVRLTREAEKLGDGSFSAKFDGGGYREADKLAERLNIAEEELKRSDKLRRELIANISHDLRTPITMIQGYSEAMRDIPGEVTAENIQIVIDESKRLSSLVNDVLDISKLESGVGNLQPVSFSLTEAVGELVRRLRAFTEKDGYTIDFRSDGDITAYADRESASRAVYNLIGNALSYTGEDKKVSVTLSRTEDGYSRVDVTDSGAGIAASEMENIWERYYKIPGEHKRALVGSGLGLSIVKEIALRSGGRCSVKSEIGRGSTFTVDLPEKKN